jgi:spore germination protein YaaH
VALFSVTNTSTGAISKSPPGYKRITGPVGAAMIAAAHRRGTRIELVFTSFGASRNTSLFGKAALQAATITSLAALVRSLGVDGVDVDVESLDPGLVPEYGAFVGQLRAALVAANPAATVSVAASAGPTGAAMASAAVAAGADRVFLMGYDYRVAGSSPGAVSPVVRDDAGRSLTWSLDLYAEVGIPPQKLLLGLPLYGMAWPVAGPVIGAPSTGQGSVWILRQHLDVLTNSAAVPQTDPLEAVDVYFLGSDGSLTAPTASPSSSGPPSMPPSSEPAASATSAPASAPGVTWTAVYIDSPATLEAKLGLGESRGLAGAGFWAIGYERGLPAFTDLFSRFVAGTVPAW